MIEQSRSSLPAVSPLLLRIAERIFGILIEEERSDQASRIGDRSGIRQDGRGESERYGPVRECLPYLPAMKAYTDDTITLVSYSQDMKDT
jgi:hypothetical protein